MRRFVVLVVLACLPMTNASAERPGPVEGTSCTRSAETIEGKPADCVICKSVYCSKTPDGTPVVCTTTTTKDCEFRDGSPARSFKIPKVITEGVKK